MNVFFIQFGLDSGAQPVIIDKLKSAGYEVIQISSGLLAKSTEELQHLTQTLSPEGENLNVSKYDPKTSEEELSKDAKLFAGIN